MCACLEEQLRPALASGFESMTTATYIGFTEAELATYQEHLRSPEGQAYIGALAGGSTSALVRRAEAVDQDLARELTKEDL